ncbi:MAG TPA: hypothetical protein VHY21_17690 [Pseudonocardiaceae bacterium]|nr:hypothetical protein [Pseudonocardiaceae bacterium]
MVDLQGQRSGGTGTDDVATGPAGDRNGAVGGGLADQRRVGQATDQHWRKTRPESCQQTSAPVSGQ